MRKYVKRTARKSYKRTVPKVLSKPATKQVKAIVKKAMDTRIEDKFECQIVPYSYALDASGEPVLDASGEASVANVTLIDGPIGGFGSLSRSSFQKIIPVINTGTDTNERIGNKISVKSCTLKLTVVALGSQSHSIDTVARILLVTPREIKSYDVATGVPPPVGAPSTYQPSPVPYGALLRNGPFAVQYGIGVPICNLLPVNTEKFIVHYDKLVRFTKSEGLNWDGGLSPNPLSGTVVSVGAQRNYFTATIKIPLPKTLMYDKLLDFYPTNACPLLCIGAQNMDNTDYVANTLGYHAFTKLYFEDA